jgi:hypothetical protein
MPTAMHDEEKLKERYQYESEAKLENIISREGKNSLEGRVATSILTERRRELRNSARIIAWATVVTAIATVAAALAAWTAVCFQFGRPQTAANESRQPALLIAPTPSPSP